MCSKSMKLLWRAKASSPAFEEIGLPSCEGSRAGSGGGAGGGNRLMSLLK